jgi:hypothetical protein
LVEDREFVTGSVRLVPKGLPPANAGVEVAK